MSDDLRRELSDVLCDKCGGTVVRDQAGRDIWLECENDDCDLWVSIL